MEIKAKIICDSVSSVNGVRLTTFEVEYPRIIHAEVMTHRVFSRNAASSRAIPFDKMLKQLDGRPVRFGEANPGMQDKGVDYTAHIRGRDIYDTNYGETSVDWITPAEAWEEAKQDAIFWSKAFKDAGYHKQVYNRLTEPFQMMKVLITATEWENFFWLRNDVAADPTLHALAKLMQNEYEKNIACLLHPGEWHLPYVKLEPDQGRYYIVEEGGSLVYMSLEDAIKVSSARCAAISFRNTDYTLEKSLQVYERLVGDERKHASAMEHQATPMKEQECGNDDEDYINILSNPDTWEKGITHSDRNGTLWSGNFREWIQHRQLIPGHNKQP